MSNSLKNDIIKLAIVDDDEILTQLLARFLSQVEKYEVLFTALDGAEFITKLENIEESLDIVILDLQMKKMNVLETISILKESYPHIKIIVFTSHYKLSFMGYMIKNGINAFIPKGIPPKKLVKVINSVYNKHFFYTDDQINVIRQYISKQSQVSNYDAIKLSEREKSVLELLCHQYTSQEIGRKLNLAKRTIDGHKNRILAKTKTKNTAGLVLYAIKNKIVDINDLELQSILE